MKAPKQTQRSPLSPLPLPERVWSTGGNVHVFSFADIIASLYIHIFNLPYSTPPTHTLPSSRPLFIIESGTQSPACAWETSPQFAKLSPRKVEALTCEHGTPTRPLILLLIPEFPC